jgi:anti-anti-sigma regulatory factor
MIRITIHQSDDDLMLRVEGCLSGPLVAELEACWLDARSMRRGRRLLVDLRGVCHVDDRGRDLMARLFEDGAEFEASGCEMPEVVREIVAGRIFSERI